MTEDISVVIPAWNEEDFIETPLDSLKGQEAEVIVVVSGEDRTAEIAKYHEVTDLVIEEERAEGPGKARNLGVKKASGDIILFTDADTEVPPDWVAKHSRHYRKEEVTGVGGPSLPLEESTWHNAVFKITQDWWVRFAQLFGLYCWRGTNSSFRRKVFEDEGGFDENLDYMEDVEMPTRLKSQGKLVFDPTCKVRTSTRRAREMGYLQLIYIYLTDYFRFFLLGRNASREYFGIRS